jgi:DNA-binding LacI/PurR family transcriptional regulator
VEAVDEPFLAARRPEPVKGKIRGISLKEISSLTGFSATTVSMVLNGRAEEFNIAEETRSKIRAAAAKHNYRPNLHARNLRRRTSNIVGLMVPILTNRFFSSMAETFESLARENDKFPLIIVVHHDRTEELNAVAYFTSQNADCIFTANPMASAEIGDICARAGVRQIALDSPEGDVCTVTTDNFAAARDLTARLIAAMRRAGRPGRLYCVGGMETHAVTLQRLEGFKAALRDAGEPFADDQFVPTLFDAAAACQGLAKLFESKTDVGGLFVNSLITMEGLIQYFPGNAETCRRVHFGVFDYHPLMALLNLNLLSVMQDAGQMMHKAYELYAEGGGSGDRRVFHIPYRIIAAPEVSPADVD